MSMIPARAEDQMREYVPFLLEEITARVLALDKTLEEIISWEVTSLGIDERVFTRDFAVSLTFQDKTTYATIIGKNMLDEIVKR